MGDHSFPRHRRLLSRADYDRVLSGGRRVSRGGMRFLVAEAVVPFARLGFIIPRRCIRSAVLRNRLRRVVRERFRLQYEQLPCSDLVFQVTATPPRLPRPQLRVTIDALFRLIFSCSLV